jgi:prevent-host-death family protein
MSTVTAKQLHSETKAILDQVEAGKTVVITRNGRPVGRLQPVAEAAQSSWSDIMSEVWAAQDKIKPSERVPNPVLLERQRRRR